MKIYSDLTVLTYALPRESAHKRIDSLSPLTSVQVDFLIPQPICTVWRLAQVLLLDVDFAGPCSFARTFEEVPATGFRDLGSMPASCGPRKILSANLPPTAETLKSRYLPSGANRNNRRVKILLRIRHL